MERESVAKILIFNEKDQVLMLRTGVHRTSPEKSYTPDLPGGLVESGESERDAAVREAEEEVAITLDPDTVTLACAETVVSEEGKSVTKLLYMARLDHTPDVTLSWEHESFEWCELTRALDAYPLQTHPPRRFYKEAIEYIMAHEIT